jgi:23S rRNA U2552 (ribose-2'-O)-methylase RlmE/FtsJ
MSYYLLPNILTPMKQSDFLLRFDNDKSKEAIINNSLQFYLSNVKHAIKNCMSEWDIYKKYTNPYEYIHTNVPSSRAAICKYKPLSRSYFKMIEMLRSLYILDSLPETPIQTFHLAEGPGGFIEAICNSRNNPEDVYHGMTLISEKDYVPGWKKSQEYLSSNPNIHLEYGADNTGNILNPDNLKYCYERYKNSMDLITGDGGFDFSVNFNDQEVTASRLIFAQIIYALLLQKKDGNFIIKFFDIFTPISVDFTCLLSSFYKKVYVIKPNTSRYANSEKYLVCKGFKYSDLSYLFDTFLNMMQELNNNSDKFMYRIFNRDMAYLFLSKLEEYNAIVGQQQIEIINNTLSMVRNSTTSERIENVKKININRCIQWCIKNKQPYNKGTTQTNIFLSNS